MKNGPWHLGSLLFYCVITLLFAWDSVRAQGTINPGTFFGTPLNDNFANRGNFDVLPYSSGTLAGATSEPGEPLIAGVSSGQTVWGTWTAPSNGVVTLTPNTSTFSPLLTVYTGNALDDLTLVASNLYLACYDDGNCGCHWRERNQVTFHVNAGTAYQICVDSAIITDALWLGFPWGAQQTTNIPPGGPVEVGLQFTPTPLNDNFANRFRLSGTRFSTNVSNVGATKEVGEPNPLGNPGGSSVWYSWTAPASGRVTLSTNEVPVYAPPSGGNPIGFFEFSISPGLSCGNENDQDPPPVYFPILAAYTGTAVNALTPTANLRITLAEFTNAVEFEAVKGTTYQIVYDGNMGTTSDTTLYLALTTPAPNANFRNRIAIHGVIVTATGYNAGATHQSGEPVLSASVGKTVWWSWTAPVSGSVSIDLSGSDYWFPVGVFTGFTTPTLQMVAESYGGLSFNAIQGQTYQIAVADDGGLTGAIKMNLHGPILDLAPCGTMVRGNLATLEYKAPQGIVAALSYSTDDEYWIITQTQNSVGGRVRFQTKPAPNASNSFYRAILFDRIANGPMHF